MGVTENLWRHKTKILTLVYFLIELIATLLNVTINRHSWWYLSLVILLIILLIESGISVVRTGKALG